MTRANGHSTPTTPSHPGSPPPEKNIHLGARLRGIRQQHGLTLRLLAEKVGVTATALHSWECGRRNPKSDHLQAFADAFQLTTSDLMSGVAAPDEAFGGAARHRHRVGPRVGPWHRAQLAEVIGACKERIAVAAGTSTDRIRIIIEV